MKQRAELHVAAACSLLSVRGGARSILYKSEYERTFFPDILTKQGVDE